MSPLVVPNEKTMTVFLPMCWPNFPPSRRPPVFAGWSKPASSSRQRRRRTTAAAAPLDGLPYLLWIRIGSWFRKGNSVVVHLYSWLTKPRPYCDPTIHLFYHGIKNNGRHYGSKQKNSTPSVLLQQLHFPVHPRQSVRIGVAVSWFWPFRCVSKKRPIVASESMWCNAVYREYSELENRPWDDHRPVKRMSWVLRSIDHLRGLVIDDKGVSKSAISSGKSVTTAAEDSASSSLLLEVNLVPLLYWDIIGGVVAVSFISTESSKPDMLVGIILLLAWFYDCRRSLLSCCWFEQYCWCLFGFSCNFR